jgi:transaldolase
VASLFISLWTGKVPEKLRDQLGIALAKRTYKAASALIGSQRWQRIYGLGGSLQ